MKPRKERNTKIKKERNRQFYLRIDKTCPLNKNIKAVFSKRYINIKQQSKKPWQNSKKV